MKNTQKIIILAFLSILIINLFYIVSADNINTDSPYYYKLVLQSGLTPEQAKTIIGQYPNENDLIAAVKIAIDNNQTEIMEVPVSSLKDQFYKPGVISVPVAKWWEGTFIWDSIDSLYKGIFGDTLTNLFLRIIGAKKDLSDRGLDLLAGFLTAIIIVIIYKAENYRLGKYWNEYSEDEVEEKLKSQKWLERLVGKTITWVGQNKTEVIAKFKVWKIILFSLIYFGVLQFPVINVVVETITLYRFTPFWIRPITSALIIGYLPALVERFVTFRRAQRIEQLKMEARAAAQIIKDMGKGK